MCCPDGREGIAIMHGGNPVSESYDTDGEYQSYRLCIYLVAKSVLTDRCLVVVEKYKCVHCLFIFILWIADTFEEKRASDHTGCFLEVLNTALVWPLLPHPDLNPSLFTFYHAKL